ncbi:coiled-coil domain-containing protein 81-like isoform X5 [Xiphias gladius]|uniref:coiled-coil domain-containing protein 81-like isoform X5 n=1 Tax=Xiphias gladius TaxID=8245 RepID=UPI001A99F830|nr:coiled-coil domain-containing protein 81-like isoform X5 [Xiphias gladius]
MADILRLVSEADRRTLPTLSQLSENDIDCIWADVSAYIERQMTLQKGVHLAGLGTFTFSQQKLDLGNKFTMIQRPIFLLAGKLVQSLGLKQTRPLAAATHLPVVQLNFTAVSQETPFGRDVVEGCIKETLLLLFRGLASEQNMFITFQGIGVLSFHNKKVQMKFNKDFVNAMDGTGRLLLAFNNRPGSSVSLLSGEVSKLQRPQTSNPFTLPPVCSHQPDNKAGDKDGWCLSPAPDKRKAGEVPQQRESKSHQTLQPAKMKAVNLSEEMNPKPPMEATDKPVNSISPPEVAPKQEEPLVNVSCSGHTRAGQAKQSEQREHAKQVAIFNLQMSEKKEKTYCPLYPTSFIFPTRPLTPAKRIQQHRYMNDLQSQVESRRQCKVRDQQNRLLMERLDRVQLVQEIALHGARQLQQKHERTKHYKRALDTQVGDKKYTDPPVYPADNSGFTRCETAASNAESRERAQKLFQVNYSAATQRKKKELHNHQAQLEKEREMLKHNKTELILDHINHFEKKRDIRKSLEDEWSRSVKLKHQRKEEERRFLRSAGQPMVDKLAQYKRCCQCKRRTTDFGETNIWKDSHYLSGSQFMI